MNLGLVHHEDVFRELEQTYSDDPRRYHTLRHIEQCLQEFDEVRHLAKEPAAVELALWFHDAIYDPRESDNEEQSARMLRRMVESPFTEEAIALIFATKHERLHLEQDAALVCDIDLAILGKPPQDFDVYERQIRYEYDWVPEQAYREGRAKLLMKFMARQSIYATGVFQDRYEVQARNNLQRSISRLTK